MNKQELIDAISSTTGASKAATGATLDAILHAVTETVTQGEVVQLIGFGTFATRARRTHWTEPRHRRGNPDCGGEDSQVFCWQGIQGRGERVKSRHVTAPAGYAELHGEIAGVVDSIRLAAARSVNALMTAAYWEVGRRIVEFEQGGEGRAGYGEALIKRLGEDLSRRFGRGFGWRNLSQMRAFYLTWPAEQILQTLFAKSPPPAIEVA
jgi:hypothetical protein